MKKKVSFGKTKIIRYPSSMKMVRVRTVDSTTCKGKIFKKKSEKSIFVTTDRGYCEIQRGERFFEDTKGRILINKKTCKCIKG